MTEKYDIDVHVTDQAAEIFYGQTMGTHDGEMTIIQNNWMAKLILDACWNRTNYTEADKRRAFGLFCKQVGKHFLKEGESEKS